MEFFCRSLVEGLCRLHRWDATAIWEMATGRRPVAAEVADLFAVVFGVPYKAWPTAPVVSANGGRYVRGMTEANFRKLLRANGRRRRRLASPVHAVLDQLDWSIADLAQHISKRMGRSVSRASMQFWAVGRRQVKDHPDGPSRQHAVQAPLEVRLVAHKVTAKEALKRGLGEEAILVPTAWPNVELE